MNLAKTCKISAVIMICLFGALGLVVLIMPDVLLHVPEDLLDSLKSFDIWVLAFDLWVVGIGLGLLLYGAGELVRLMFRWRDMAFEELQERRRLIRDLSAALGEDSCSLKIKKKGPLPALKVMERLHHLFVILSVVIGFIVLFILPSGIFMAASIWGTVWIGLLEFHAVIQILSLLHEIYEYAHDHLYTNESLRQYLVQIAKNQKEA
ncbi:hypothetical protein [Gehongia tenuis]|uniref:Uncharacterized protein n=1 Tax=Gehongia tenuis TaxID=2763655 RepID=A0A926D3E0_9FIRM|nr:hypothetical protein [Gehongia tenuis]MBC8530516.1 hypothetical protein [Gehongia tenuis]